MANLRGRMKKNESDLLLCTYVAYYARTQKELSCIYVHCPPPRWRSHARFFCIAGAFPAEGSPKPQEEGLVQETKQRACFLGGARSSARAAKRKCKQARNIVRRFLFASPSSFRVGQIISLRGKKDSCRPRLVQERGISGELRCRRRHWPNLGSRNGVVVVVVVVTRGFFFFSER